MLYSFFDWLAIYFRCFISLTTFEKWYKLESEFVLHWGYRDLDRLQAMWDGTGGVFDSYINGFASLAKDCGLIDEKGRPRPSFHVWQKWLSLPKSIE